MLQKEAGPGLKKECEGVSKPLRVGSLVTTGAHNLKKSKYILHIVLPNYDGKSEGVCINNEVKFIACSCRY